MTDHVNTRNGTPTSFIGGEAVEIVRLATLLSGLRLEKTGMRLSRHVNSRKIAKQMTGLRTNDYDTLIAAVQKLLDAQKVKVPYVETNPAYIDTAGNA